MTRRANPIASKLMALGLLLLLIAAAVLVPLELISRFTDGEDSLLESRKLLGRIEASVREMQARATAEGERQQTPGADLFVGGTSEGVALAALQTRLAAIAAAAGLRLQSAGELPARTEGALRLIGLRIDMTAAIEPLVEVLHRIETTQPIMLVEAARLRSSQAEGKAEIDASFDVFVAMAASAPGED